MAQLGTFLDAIASSMNRWRDLEFAYSALPMNATKFECSEARHQSQAAMHIALSVIGQACYEGIEEGRRELLPSSVTFEIVAKAADLPVEWVEDVYHGRIQCRCSR